MRWDNIFQQPTQTPSFVRSFTLSCLPWQRRHGKHLQQISDKCSGGGIIWPRAAFRSVVFLLSFVQYSLIFNIRRDSSISVKSLILMSHASPLRQQLHWLSVHSRIRYELCMLCMMYTTARLLAIEQISVSAAVILDCVHPRGMV